MSDLIGSPLSWYFWHGILLGAAACARTSFLRMAKKTERTFIRITMSHRNPQNANRDFRIFPQSGTN